MPTVLELSDLDGSNGFVVEGAFFSDYSGVSVSRAGDVNGDGVGDFIIGADRAGYYGESYIVFGSTGAFPARFDAWALDGSNGFVVSGAGFGDYSGLPVSAAGDVNGDGFDDILIGAQSAGFLYEGASYVVFGSSAGFGADLDLAALDGSDGFAIYGEFAYDFSGVVAGAGDVNGDGIDDIVIGAPGEYGLGFAGATYVVFGATSGFAAGLELSSLDGTNGFIIDGVAAGDYSGTAVAGAGDVNGDGIDDIVIGAPGAGANFRAGETYVVFGSSSGFAATLALSTLDGTNGFSIVGANEYDLSGASVSGAGDINGDGIDDIIIGAFAADPDGTIRAGASYVVFGSSGGFAATIELSALDGGNGFAIEGADFYDYAGYDIAAAGDVNGDGVDDLIVGAPGVGVLDAGETYVVFGSTAAFAASIEVSSLDGAAGFAIAGEFPYDESGLAVSGAGDVNGDGIDDLLIGAPYAFYGAGETYVVFGSTALGVAAPTAAADVIAANDAANSIDGLAGDDAISGLGGADSLDGNIGNDTLRGGDGFDSLVGAGGSDVLDGGEGDDTLDGGEANDALVGGLGADLVIGGAKSDLIDGGGGDDVLAGGQGGDSVLGGAGADMLNGGSQRDILDGGADNDTISGGIGKDTALGGDGGDSLVGGVKGDQLDGGADGDTLRGEGGNDRFDGGDGGDVLFAGAGHDSVYGGTGDDNLAGANGDDTLVGGDGNDMLSGGAGADWFVFGLGDDADAFLDFGGGAVGGDVIRLVRFGAAFDTFAEVLAAASDDGTDTTIDFGGGDVLVLKGVLVADLAADDFAFG